MPTLPAGTTHVYVFAVERDVPRLQRTLTAWSRAAERPFVVISFGAGLPLLQEVARKGAVGVYSVPVLPKS
jgi:hypothetical protein